MKKGIEIIHEDDFSMQVASDARINMKLQIQAPGMELVRYEYKDGVSGIFSHGGTQDYTAIYYVKKGQLILKNSEGIIQVVEEDCIFSITRETPFISFESRGDCTVLQFSNVPIFQPIQDSLKAREELLREIQEYDGYTGEHCVRVQNLVIKMARIMDLNLENPRELLTAAKCHDVGKIKIPHEIIAKPGPLTAAEYEEVKKHSAYSSEMIRPLAGDRVAEIVGAHHERLDGKGYPNHLTAEQIPFEAKLIAVADAFDAMTHNRGYNKIKTVPEAIEELHRCQGTQFDPRCVEALCKCYEMP